MKKKGRVRRYKYVFQLEKIILNHSKIHKLNIELLLYDNERDINLYDCDFYLLNMVLNTKAGIQCAYDIRKNICLLDVLYIECFGRMSNVYFQKGDLVVKRKVLDWVNLLDKDIYVKAYKGLLVNLKNVNAIDDDTILLKNGCKLFVSKYCKKNLHKKYYEFVDALMNNHRI